MALPVVAGILTAVKWLDAVVGEAWTRYFLLLAGLVGLNVFQGLTGVFFVEGTIGYVVSTIFGLEGFAIPVYYGISSLVIIFATMPFILFLVNMATR